MNHPRSFDRRRHRPAGYWAFKGMFMLVLRLIVLGLVAQGGLAVAQAPAQQPAAVFAGLTGSCWRSQMDATTTDTHCFEAAVGGKMVADTHKVRNAAGEVVYEGVSVYLLDKASGKLAYEYFYSAPGRLKGYGWREGEEIRFTSKPDAAKPDIVWKLGADAYDVMPASPELGHPGHFVKLKPGN